MEDAIIIVGTAAEGAVREALRRERGKLVRRFPYFFAPEYRLGYCERSSAEMEDTRRRILRIAHEHGLSAYVPGGWGGVMKALWDLGEAAGRGFRVDLLKIPVRQETIEICEYLGLNPYEEDSGGLIAAAAADGSGLETALRDAGVPCAVVGALTGEKAKVLRCRGHIRYIENKGYDR